MSRSISISPSASSNSALLASPPLASSSKLEGRASAEFLVVKLAVDTAQIEFGAVAGAEVERERSTDPFPFHVIVAILDFVGIDDAIVIDIPAFRFDIVGFKLALIVRHASGHSDIIGQPCGKIDAALWGHMVGIIIVAALDFAGQQILLAVKGADGLDLDRSANGIGIHIGGQRLLDFNRFNQIAGNHVESDRSDIAFGGGDADTVQGRGVEIGIKTAHRNKAAFALVVEDIDAGYPAEGFRDILVGKLTDGIARDNRSYAIGFALAGQRTGLIGALADDKDFGAGARLQRDIGNGGPGICYGYAALSGDSADITGFERICAGRDFWKPVAAVAVGGDNPVQLDDADLGGWQSSGFARVADHAADRAGPGRARQGQQNTCRSY